METKAIEKLIRSVYALNEYPALAYQIEEWERTRPLENISIIDAAPVYRNTLIKHLALIAAGARLTVGLSKVMAYDESIVHLIESCNIPIVHAEETPLETDIILDCAAAFSHWPVRIGYAELTRSGMEAYTHSVKPVFLADSGRIKHIETCLGTGESYFRAMKQMGYDDWTGKKLVVFGSGKVGTGIITYAHRKGACIYVVTEPESVKEQVACCATAIIDYKDTQAVSEAVLNAYAIVTATGVKHALEGNCPAEALIHSQALLANMGVEDEFGPSIPKERVLMEKHTLNFILDEPTHLKYIDATMALHNAGATYLIAHPESKGTIEPPEELEEELLNICRERGCISNELVRI